MTTPTRAGYDDRRRTRLFVRPERDGRSLDQVLTCDFCGRTVETEVETLTWTTSVERGRKRTFCDTCSRTHLRAMEGKLDSEWW
ncbi:hypothetical protein [Nocardioides sp. InS609-2]|uniref:hypothetical protein n=1 Tax=Nocardioides sp. InS609-2 TaxID=2760705 RepID=UPI0020C066E0|nr:hypothetical protein [Nocardioides sp. InS609-2]